MPTAKMQRCHFIYFIDRIRVYLSQRYTQVCRRVCLTLQIFTAEVRPLWCNLSHIFTTHVYMCTYRLSRYIFLCCNLQDSESSIMCK